MRAWLGRLRRRWIGRGVRRAVAGAGHSRAALLLYTVAAFREPPAPGRHQNEDQQRELARALAERGYQVDAADFDERQPAGLRGRYDLVVDLHPRADPLYAGRLAPGAVRIAYMTGSEPERANAAERARLEEVVRRRGVRLAPRRQAPPIPVRAWESFDAMFLVGGRVTLESYAGLPIPPVHHLPNSAWDAIEPTDPARRDPRRFLFLGSVGQVHKGLDLLLETFRERPDLELIVCGHVRREADFARAYRRELFGRANVRTLGFVELRDPAFRELQSRCGWMVLPSCAEGQAGTVTVALAYGLPCVVSAACGFDDPELVVLPECGLDAVRREIDARARETQASLAERAAQARALYLRRYRPEHYARAVRAALDAVLARAGAGVGAAS